MALEKQITLERFNVALDYWRITSLFITVGTPSRPQPHAIIQLEGLLDQAAADAGAQSLRESRHTILIENPRFAHYFSPAALAPADVNPWTQAYAFLKSTDTDDRTLQPYDLSDTTDA